MESIHLVEVKGMGLLTGDIFSVKVRHIIPVTERWAQNERSKDSK